MTLSSLTAGEQRLGVRERRARQKSLLRQEIIDAARDILLKEGYDHLSMRRVAEKIDYSATAIYLHFKDRDDLVFSVCEEFMAGLVRALQDVVQREADPVTALKKGLRRYIDLGLENPKQYQATFIVPHRPDPSNEGRFKAPDTQGMTAFAFLPRLIAESIRLKKMSSKIDVEAASRALWAGVHGIVALLIVMPTFDWGNKDKVIDQLVNTLVDGLKK